MQGLLENQNIGGGGGSWGGGNWGIAPVGVIGINTLFDRGKRGDDCDNNGNTVFDAAILSKLGTIEGAVPLAALGTQNAILEQTIALGSIANQNNLSQLQATAGVKDSVQNGVASILLNANQNTQSVLSAICSLGSKIDQNRISELETQLARQENHSRSRDVEVNVSQVVSQAQAQAQQQAQLQGLFGVISNLANDLQLVKQGQTIFNSGTMAASGTQAAANTKVN